MSVPAKKIEELQRQTTDASQQSGGSTTTQQTVTGQQQAAATVQPGTVSQQDSGKLVKVPENLTVGRVGQKNQERIQQLWQSANKPTPRTTPQPEIEAGSHRKKKQEYEEATKEKPVPKSVPAPVVPKGTVARAKEQLAKSQSGSSQSTAQQAGDKYEFLKTPPDQLQTDEEKQKRQELLEQKYVVDYKKKKEEEKESLIKELGEEAKTKEETRQSEPLEGKSEEEEQLEKKDKRMEKWADAADIVDFAVGTTTEHVGSLLEDKGHDTASTAVGLAGNVVGLGTNLIGTVTNAWGARRKGAEARQKRQKGDKYGAILSGMESAGNAVGVLSGLTGFASSGFGVGTGIASLAGKDMDGHWASETGDYLGIASTGLGILGSGIETLKGGTQAFLYGRLAGRKQTGESIAKMNEQYEESDKKYKQLKKAYQQNKGSLTREQKMDMLKQRHERKRSKEFAETMAIAKEQAGLKAKAGGISIASGLVSGLGGGMKLAGSLVSKFGGDSPVAKMLGLGLGAVGGLIGLGSKLVSKLGEKKEKKAQTSANERRGKEYLEKKAKSLMNKAEAQSDHMTEDEAKKIVAKRLGVADPTEYGLIYKKLAERRADRILNKEEGYQEVLAALGLSEKADKATIMEALGVSDD